MSIFGNACAWRATVLACGLALIGASAGHAAGTLSSSAPAVSTAGSDEPFGLLASSLSEGALREKWLSVERELDDELLVLALCEEDRARCASVPAKRLLAIIDDAKARDGRARLGEINRALNLAIRPVSDHVQYGEADVWRSPLALLAAGAGDCEDYAIAKFVALRAAGVAAGDLRIIIVRDVVRNEDHAVTAARLEGRWLLLDNRRMAMIEDEQVRNYRPLFAVNFDGVRRYLPMPLMSAVTVVDVAPAGRGVLPGTISASNEADAVIGRSAGLAF